MTSICKDAPNPMSSGKCKFKQWDTTTHLLDWPKSATLTIPNAGEDLEQQEFSLIVGGNIKMVQTLWKTVWQFPTKLNILLLYESAIMLLGVYAKELITYGPTKTCTLKFIAALSIIVKTWKQPRCPSVGKWINKLWYIQTMEYYSVLKTNEPSNH